MLRIKDLSVAVDDKPVLNKINLHIPEGEVHLLLGPNGSGKTSLMMSILGYPRYRTVDGAIMMRGRDVTELDLTGRSRLGMGLAEQRPPTINGVKLKMLLDYLLERNADGRSDADELLDDADMRGFLERDLNAGLSGGEIKKSELLLLISRNPHLVMLDEPDSGVDHDSLELINSMINRLLSVRSDHPVKRRTGLIITHSDSILKNINADKAHVMLDGELVCSGNPTLIMNKISESGFRSCRECVQNEK